jgi:protein TonB
MMDKETTVLRNWDDVVFAHRHKAYGAYPIRQAYVCSIIFGLGASMVIASLLIMLPQIMSMLGYELHKPSTPQTGVLSELSFTCNFPLPPPPAKRRISQTLVNAAPIVNATEVGTRPPKNETELVSSLAKIASPNLHVALDSIQVTSRKEIICFLPGADVMPTYPGGQQAIGRFIAKHFKYPSRACLTGTAYIGFVVHSDGSIVQVKCIRGISSDFDKEAMRVVSLMNGWIPGQQNGRNVAVRMMLPIKSELIH